MCMHCPKLIVTNHDICRSPTSDILVHGPSSLVGLLIRPFARSYLNHTVFFLHCRDIMGCQSLKLWQVDDTQPWVGGLTVIVSPRSGPAGRPSQQNRRPLEASI